MPYNQKMMSGQTTYTKKELDKLYKMISECPEVTEIEEILIMNTEQLLERAKVQYEKI